MPRGMRFGLCTDQNLSFATLVERWQHFERLGFDSGWDCDHLSQPGRPTGPYYQSWTLLAALAARTSRIRIGVLVSSNTFRHPGLLAHEAMTVDHVSNGRLELGLGAGWYVPEHEQFGIALPPPGELVGRFHEAVQIVDGLLRHGHFTFAGKYYRLKDAHVRPSPVQRPGHLSRSAPTSPACSGSARNTPTSGTRSGPWTRCGSETASSTSTARRSDGIPLPSGGRSTAGRPR